MNCLLWLCRSCGYGSFRCCGRLGGRERVTAKLKRPFSLSLAKSQPEKSEATSDNESDPTHPHRYRPISDDDGPLHKNPHQMEQRHHGEDHPSHERKRFCVHAPSSQGAAIANVERTIWFPYPESNVSRHPRMSLAPPRTPTGDGLRGPF